MPKDPNGITKYVTEKMKKRWELIVKTQLESDNEFFNSKKEKISSMHKERGEMVEDEQLNAEIKNESDYIQRIQDQEYLKLLAEAFDSSISDKSRYAYIDPAGTESVEALRCTLLSLPTIPKDAISFERSSDSAKKFEANFSTTVSHFLTLIEAIDTFEKYPTDLINRLLKNCEEEITRCDVALATISSGKADEKVLEQLDKAFGEDTFKKKTEELKTSIKEKEKEATNLEVHAQSLIDGPPVWLNHEDEWNESGCHVTKRICYTNESVPFTADITTGKDTTIEKVYSRDNHHFDVLFGAGGTGNQVAAGAIIAGGGVAAGAAILAFTPLFFLSPLVGLAAGEIATKATMINLYVKVKYKVESRDWPENAETIKKDRDEAALKRKTVATKKLQLKELIESTTSDLPKRVNTLKTSAEKEKAGLEAFERVRNVVYQMEDKYKKDLDIVCSVGRVLGEKSGQRTNIGKLVDLRASLGQSKSNENELVSSEKVPKVNLEELSILFPV